MAAIFHDSGMPSFLAPPPRFSFIDIAEIVAPAPEQYAEARSRYMRWERKMGNVWFEHNHELAMRFWEAKRPWWLI